MDSSDSEFEHAVRERGRRRRGIYEKPSRWPAVQPPRRRWRHVLIAVILLVAAGAVITLGARTWYLTITTLGPGLAHTHFSMLHVAGNPSATNIVAFKLDPNTHVLARRLTGPRESFPADSGSPLDPMQKEPIFRFNTAGDSDELRGAGDWQAYEGVRFLTAPVFLSTQVTGGPPRQLPLYNYHLFALEYGTGAVLVATYRPREGMEIGQEGADELAEAWARPWQHDTPGAWGWDNSTAGGRFAWQPSLVLVQLGYKHGPSDVFLDVYGVTPRGVAMRRSMVVRDNGTQTWRGDWCEVGTGIVGEIGLAVNYYAKGGNHHAVAIKDGEYQHALAKHGVEYWDGEWMPLGRPHECQDLAPGELGFPQVISWDKIETEVIAVCGGKVWHKTRNVDGKWSSSWTHFGLGIDYREDGEGVGARLAAHGLVSDGNWWRTLVVMDEDEETVYQITRSKPLRQYGLDGRLVAGSQLFTWSRWKSYHAPVAGNVSIKGHNSVELL